jgi:hypothetical protein
MSQRPYRPFTPPPAPPWAVHPCACGGCGIKGLQDRGLGPCRWCRWQKPERERLALAGRLALNPELARRLEQEAA